MLMMENPVNRIITFQLDRQLPLQDFEATTENVNIIEELLESRGFDVPKENRTALRLAWSQFTKELQNQEIAVKTEHLAYEDVVDAYCDVIVFAVGAIMKLGYHPTIALHETGKEINSRRGAIVDGKFEKDLSDEAKAKWYKADYSKAVHNWIIPSNTSN